LRLQIVTSWAILSKVIGQDQMMKTTAKLAKIDALLNDLPTFRCKEGCADCCGPVLLSRLEYSRCIEASGRSAEDVKQQMQNNLKQGIYTCPLLNTETRRCSVYAVRPAICRLFGVVKGELLCPHGYAPESSALLSNERAQKILRKVEELGK
jgi:Fe-S-cluster containining protein